jgi:hypothetical protein
MRKLTEIEVAYTADCQRPHIIEIKMHAKGGPKSIHGTIMHNSTRSYATWDALTGECFIRGTVQTEHNLIFTR